MTATLENPVSPAVSEASPSFTIRADILAEFLANVSLFAGTDDSLPVLCAVRLEVADGMLHAVATDRYHLAQFRTTVKGGEGFAFTLGTGDIKSRLLPVLKAHIAYGKTMRHYPAFHDDNPVTFTRDGGAIAYRVGDMSGTIAETAGDYPRVLRLLEGFAEAAQREEQHPVQVYCYDPARLEVIAKLKGAGKKLRAVYMVPPADRSKPLLWGTAPDGDTWEARGAIMPVRLPGDNRLNLAAFTW